MLTSLFYEHCRFQEQTACEIRLSALDDSESKNELYELLESIDAAYDTDSRLPSELKFLRKNCILDKNFT